MAAWFHLWMGIVSGLIVFIVCLTGCIWCFNEEIKDAIYPQYKFSEKVATLSFPQVMTITHQLIPEEKITSVDLRKGHAIEVYFGGRLSGNALLLHPQTGQLLNPDKKAPFAEKFFAVVLMGHRFLWLPFKIGRPIINYSVLIFVVILITGLVLWWPKRWTKNNVKKALTLKRTNNWKRINYDLHNVLGFYACSILVVLAFTGMIMGIAWFSKAVYASTGGKVNSQFAARLSTPTDSAHLPIDTLYQKIDRQTKAAYPKAEGNFYFFPADSTGSYFVSAYFSNVTFYKTVNLSFDQFSGKKIEVSDIYSKEYDQLNGGEKLRKMNYDIHVGTIFGIWGKILVFLAGFIGASLPITGFLYWLGRKKKKKKVVS